MTDKYSDPDKTIRSIVEDSKAYYDGLFDKLNDKSGLPTRPPLLDEQSNLAYGSFDNMYSSMLNTVVAERTRLQAILDKWDGKTSNAPVA